MAKAEAKSKVTKKDKVDKKLKKIDGIGKLKKKEKKGKKDKEHVDAAVPATNAPEGTAKKRRREKSTDKCGKKSAVADAEVRCQLHASGGSQLWLRPCHPAGVANRSARAATLCYADASTHATPYSWYQVLCFCCVVCEQAYCELVLCWEQGRCSFPAAMPLCPQVLQPQKRHRPRHT
jgi:hypothetical protein